MPGNLNWIPQSVIESWPPINTVDPIRRGWLPAFAMVWQSVSTLLVAGRCYLRYRNQAGSLGLDDLMMLIGWFFSIGFTAIAWYGSERGGIDRHTWDVPRDIWVETVVVAWVAQIIFVISTTSIKLSVLMFYRRMVKDSYSRTWLWVLRGAIAISLSASVSVLISYCLICQPLNAYWLVYDYHYNKPYTCINGDVLTILTGFLTVASDWYAVLLPLLMLRRYQLDVPRRQKIALNVIFGLGFLCGAAGVVRTYYLWELHYQYDLTWTGFNLLVWCIVELQLALICACAPACRVFFRRYMSRPLRRTFDGSAIRRQSKRWTKGSSQPASPTPWRDSRLQDDQFVEGGGPDTKRLTLQSVEEIAESGGSTPRSPAAVHRPSSDMAGAVQTVEGVETYPMEQMSPERRPAFRRPNTADGEDSNPHRYPMQRHDFAQGV